MLSSPGLALCSELLKTRWYWCHSFSVLQSVRQRHGAAMKKEQVKKFLFQLCFVRAHKSRRFPQSLFSFFLHSTHLFILVFSHSSCHIKVKRVFGLPSEYQMLVGFKNAPRTQKSCLWICCKRFFFFAIETNPWQAEEKRQQFMLHTLYRLSSSVKVKVKTKVFLST